MDIKVLQEVFPNWVHSQSPEKNAKHAKTLNCANTTLPPPNWLHKWNKSFGLLRKRWSFCSLDVWPVCHLDVFFYLFTIMFLLSFCFVFVQHVQHWKINLYLLDISIFLIYTPLNLAELTGWRFFRKREHFTTSFFFFFTTAKIHCCENILWLTQTSWTSDWMCNVMEKI